MSLQEKINNDLKEAMKAKNEAALRALRAVKSAILLENTSGKGELDHAAETKLLQKLVKQRKDSIEIYNQQGRTDLAQTEIEEVHIIEKYLPAMLSDDEIKSQLMQLIAQVGATSAADMGKVMGAATKHFAGKADNKTVSAL
ncbi:MAG TPA: GatB/YqeY domain-containing protein, partial [Bacteroidia bacterium]|nr:GatB/YqeY domain-containing protein [Bacteroidia bacterium]